MTRSGRNDTRTGERDPRHVIALLVHQRFELRHCALRGRWAPTLPAEGRCDHVVEAAQTGPGPSVW